MLGGTQIAAHQCMDEAWALPSEKAALLALRQQQIIAEESGVANTVDPLGGSYFVETLTNQIEQAAWRYLDDIDEMGGMLKAIEAGFPQARSPMRPTSRPARSRQHEREIVGVNDFAGPTKSCDPDPRDHAREQEQRTWTACAASRRARYRAHAAAMQRLRTPPARRRRNLMPDIIEAVRAYATLGEMCNLLRGVYGEYREPLAV